MRRALLAVAAGQSSTSGVGVVGSATSPVQWLSTGVDAGCNSMARLYCFEQP